MGLLALLLAFAGCQRGVDEYDESPQANVEALWRMIDEHYCFLDYKEQSGPASAKSTWVWYVRA